ncbi:hypothetical protein Pmani_027203 [Petrolisthes manimaculis]|nr:hypothetical protein Pmani_027203 [Petrolisthes manimaculis]
MLVMGVLVVMSVWLVVQGAEPMPLGSRVMECHQNKYSNKNIPANMCYVYMPGIWARPETAFLIPREKMKEQLENYYMKVSDKKTYSAWVKCGKDRPYRMVVTPCRAKQLGTKTGYKVSKDVIFKNILLGHFRRVDGEVKSGYKVTCKDNTTMYLVKNKSK